MGRPKKLAASSIRSATRFHPIAPGMPAPPALMDPEPRGEMGGYNMYLVPRGYQPVLVPIEKKREGSLFDPRVASEKIPRAQNCFILYRKEKSKEIIASYPDASNKDVSRMTGTMWRNEPEEVKQMYREKANEIKRQHQLLYPHYRYCPRHNRDKPKLPRSSNSKSPQAPPEMSPEAVTSSPEGLNFPEALPFPSESQHQTGFLFPESILLDPCPFPEISNYPLFAANSGLPTELFPQGQPTDLGNLFPDQLQSTPQFFDQPLDIGDWLYPQFNGQMQPDCQLDHFLFPDSFIGGSQF